MQDLRQNNECVSPNNIPTHYLVLIINVPCLKEDKNRIKASALQRQHLKSIYWYFHYAVVQLQWTIMASSEHPIPPPKLFFFFFFDLDLWFCRQQCFYWLLERWRSDIRGKVYKQDICVIITAYWAFTRKSIYAVMLANPLIMLDYRYLMNQERNWNEL